jgi:hypothetical protein
MSGRVTHTFERAAQRRLGVAHPLLFRGGGLVLNLLAATVAHTIDLDFYSVFPRRALHCSMNFLRGGVDLEYG